MMDFATVIQAIQSVGLPIVMVIWFMVRTDNIIQRNSEALEALRELEGRELEALRVLIGKDIEGPHR